MEFFAGMDTYPAKDTLVGVVIEAGGRGIQRELLLWQSQAAYSSPVDAELGHQLLELTFATAGTASAGNVVVGDK